MQHIQEHTSDELRVPDWAVRHTESCLDATFCDPCQSSRQCNAANGVQQEFSLSYCLIALVCPMVTQCQIRTKINTTYSIDEGAVGAAIRGCCFPCCSNFQTHRELTLRSQYPGGFCVSKPFQMF